MTSAVLYPTTINNPLMSEPDNIVTNTVNESIYIPDD